MTAPKQQQWVAQLAENSEYTKMGEGLGVRVDLRVTFFPRSGKGKNDSRVYSE